MNNNQLDSKYFSTLSIIMIVYSFVTPNSIKEFFVINIIEAKIYLETSVIYFITFTRLLLQLYKSDSLLIILGLFLYMIICCFIYEFNSYSLSSLISFSTFFLWCIYFYDLPKSTKLINVSQLFILYFIVTSIAIFLLIFKESFGLSQNVYEFESRLFTTLGNPLITALIGLLLLPRTKALSAKWQIFTYFFIGVIILMTGSRFAFVTSLILFLHLYTSSLNSRHLTLFFTGCFIFCLVYFNLLPEDILYRLSFENSDFEKEFFRFETIRTGIQIFFDSPVLGLGLGNFYLWNRDLIKYRLDSYDSTFINTYYGYSLVEPHNLYLYILVSIGILGIILFFLFFYFLYRKSDKFGKYSIIICMIYSLASTDLLIHMNASLISAYIFSKFINVVD